MLQGKTTYTTCGADSTSLHPFLVMEIQQAPWV